MADTGDLKSFGRNTVPVRVREGAPKKKENSMDTIRTLEELLVNLQDHQSFVKTDKNAASPFHQGKIDGLEIAIVMVQAAIRDESKYWGQ